jgi:transposase
MAMGTRKQRERQESLWYGGELQTAPGHPFYQRLNEILDKAGFDRFCEENCGSFYHAKLGRPSLAPGLYFRIMMIGFFEGIDSERGIAWRLADSLTLRQFVSIGLDERTPDHVTISRTRRLIDPETHQKVFAWVLQRLAQGGLIRGKTIGVDSTTLEANAAMKSIVRRDTGESYTQYLQRLAEAEGVLDADAAALRRMDRKRAKRMSNDDWESPSDGQAEIARLKDGRTALAYKVENAVDMETGAIVAVTAHGGATADTATIEATVVEAGVAVSELIAEKTADGRYRVNADGVEEAVADKGYHSNDTAVGLRQLQVRTYIAEPDRGRRNWQGKTRERDAVYANRRRIRGERGKQLQRRRGERIERNFAHQFDTGGMDRLWVRGRINVHKKLLLQAAACNLALLMRSRYGAGKPKAAHDLLQSAFFLFFGILRMIEAADQPDAALPNKHERGRSPLPFIHFCWQSRKSGGLDTGC